MKEKEGEGGVLICMKSVSLPLPTLPPIALSFVIALPYLLCAPRLPPTILLRSDLPENALQSESSWFHILSIYRCRMDGREKKVVRVLPCSRSVHLPLLSCEEGGNGTQEVEQMQKQTVRAAPTPACLTPRAYKRRPSCGEGSGTSGKHVGA